MAVLMQVNFVIKQAHGTKWVFACVEQGVIRR